jgi:hypothetical protein
MTMSVLSRRKQAPLSNVNPHPEKEPECAVARRFCVLVSSSDRARDIFEIVFQNAETIWRDCDWPRYVGFTSKHPGMYGFKALAAKGPSDWMGELGDQLDGLPADIQYVLRIDEDALFMSPINGSELNAIANLMVREDLSYVTLVPVARNLPGRLVEYFRSKFDKRPLRPISFSEPYYSSVELAIWKRSYLRSLLREVRSNRELEHKVTNERHYAVWRPIMRQEQIVSGGKWSCQASRKLAQQGISLDGTKREFETFSSRIRGIRESVSFQVAGYLSFRIRRRLNKLPLTWPQP